MDIEIIEGYAYLEEIKVIFEEYTTWLGIDLGYQNYAEEVSSLPEKYARPTGRLYLACCEGVPAGCVALRKIDDRTGELKRLYVRDQFRGRKVGALLVEQVIREAKAIGYRSVLLDTLVHMESAKGLYHKLGFVEIQPYYDSPQKDTTFLCLNL